MTSEDDVRGASAQFYAALNRALNGDAGALADIWSHEPAVTTMHPIGGREVGWQAVRDAWERMAHLTAEGEVTLGDQLIRVAGDMAYELGVERGWFTFAGESVSVDVRVTNVYRRETGAWKIVHHHADIASR